MDIKVASNDLIYVLEYSIEENLVSQERGIDLYKRILSVMKGVKGSKDLESIRNELKAMGVLQK